MQLEEFFDSETVETRFGPVEVIRFKDTRIGLEHVIEPYLNGESPERIQQGYRNSLRLEQVYAAITYYLGNTARVEAYLRRGKEVGDSYYQEYLQREPPDVVKRLRALKAEQAQQAAAGG